MSIDINHKIKTLRKEKGMTLQQLADLTDFTKGYLSRIENSTGSPRLPTLQRIARALEVDIGDFFRCSENEHHHPHHIDLVGADARARPPIFDSSAAYSYRPLVHNFSGKYMAPYLLRIKKGHTEQLTHDSEEMIYIISGTIILLYGGKQYLLKSEDSAYFDSRWEHQLFNESDEPAELLNVVYDYRRF